MDVVTALLASSVPGWVCVVAWQWRKLRDQKHQLASRTVIRRPHTPRTVAAMPPLPEEAPPADVAEAIFIRANAAGSNSKFS